VLLGFATSEDGSLHAEKFYRTTAEEFGASRPAFRWPCVRARPGNRQRVRASGTGLRGGLRNAQGVTRQRRHESTAASLRGQPQDGPVLRDDNRRCVNADHTAAACGHRSVAARLQSNAGPARMRKRCRGGLEQLFVLSFCS